MAPAARTSRFATGEIRQRQIRDVSPAGPLLLLDDEMARVRPEPRLCGKSDEGRLRRAATQRLAAQRKRGRLLDRRILRNRVGIADGESSVGDERARVWLVAKPWCHAVIGMPTY